MNTYWLLDREGRQSIKGQYSTPVMTQVDGAATAERRGSNVSRAYSPVTLQEVAQISRTTTPVPMPMAGSEWHALGGRAGV